MPCWKKDVLKAADHGFLLKTLHESHARDVQSGVHDLVSQGLTQRAGLVQCPCRQPDFTQIVVITPPLLQIRFHSDSDTFTPHINRFGNASHGAYYLGVDRLSISFSFRRVASTVRSRPTSVPLVSGFIISAYQWFRERRRQ